MENSISIQQKMALCLNAKKSAIMHVTPSRQQSNSVASGIMWNGVNVPVVAHGMYTLRKSCRRSKG
jgi:ABC-type transport system involved in cytochrome c biogenesis permease subunit